MILQRDALIGLFAVSILWGCNYPVSAYLLHGFSPIFLSTVRICFTSLFLICLGCISKGLPRPSSKEWKYLAGAGVFGTLFNQCFYFTGLHHSTPANASLILAMAPIATIVLERFIYKIRLTIYKSVGAVISLIGVISIVGVAGGSFHLTWGDFNLLLAMLSLSISLLFIRGLAGSMSSYAITIFATVFGSLLMIPAAGVEASLGNTVVSHHWYMWLLLAVAGIVAQGLAGFWWNRGVAVTGAGTASMFMNIQPFVAIIVSHFILGDAIHLNQVFGGILILLGVYVANKQRSTNATVSSSQAEAL